MKHGRGKVLGGSSAINVLALVWPSKSNIDTWAKLGNKGWDWEGLHPYFKKFNTYHPPSDKTLEALDLSYVKKDNYGSSGPIQGSFPEWFGPLGAIWAQTFKQLGHSSKGEPLAGAITGGFNTTSTVDPKTWERSHAGNAYYAPVADRPNLKLVTECIVQKLQLERAVGGVTATGVHASHGGKKYLYRAKNEVLMCAGVFHTPQLLELSGIGNPEILQKHGIETIVNSPHVGENLQDHAMTGFAAEVTDGTPTIDMIRDPQVVQGAMQAYMSAKSGPLTASFHSFACMPLVEALTEPGRGEALKLIESELSKAHNPQSPAEASQYAMLRQILENPDESTAFMASGPSQAHLDAETQKDLFAISDPHNYICFLLALSYPFSRGTVHISSSNVDDLPQVDPRYLSHPIDVEMLARHLQWVGKLPSAKPLADLIKPGGVTIPRNTNVESLEAAKEHVRRNLVTYNHPCGTCAMMPEKLGGVVDDRLKVYGVSKLRIVDASVFPLIPKVNIQSTVYAMAEKAADLIKEDYP